MTRALHWVTQGERDDVRAAALSQGIGDGGEAGGGCLVVGSAEYLDGEALGASVASRWRLGLLCDDDTSDAVGRLAALGYHHVLRWPRDAQAIGDTVASLEARNSAAHSPVVRERLALQVAQVGVWEIDVQTMRISWDERVTELLGMPAPEHFTSYEDAVERYVQPSDASRVAELVANVVTNGASGALMLNVKTADGSPRTIRVSAALVEGRVLGVLQDISEMRQLEQALYDSEARLRGIVESAADGIITVDQSGLVHSLNPAARRLFGLDDETAPGLELSQLVRSPRTLLDFSATGGGLLLVEGRRANDETVELEAAVSMLAPPALRTVVLRDVTQRNRESLRLRDATDRVMDTVARELHDDLGQTLTAIALSARKLELGVSADMRAIAAGVMQQANDAIGVVRRISTGLAAEAQRPLADLLVELSRRMEGVFSMQCSVTTPPDFPRLPLTAVAHLRLLAKEALLNAWRHGQARHATIILRAEAGQGVLEISNDGLPLPQPLPSYGVGVNSMAHRARLVGGSLQLVNEPAGGVRLRCTFAIPEESALLP